MTRKLSPVVGLLLLAVPLVADETGEKLMARALESPVAWETLAHLTDNIGPRLSGSRGANEAVRWTTAKLKSWGLEARNEPIMVPHWVRGVEEAKLVSHLDQKIVVTALGGSVATPPDGISAEVVEVASLDEVNALGEQVRGKIVLFNKALDMKLVEDRRAFAAYGAVVPLRGGGPSRAAQFGAVATLVRSIGSRSLRTPHTGALRYDPNYPQIPAGAIAAEDADLIHRLLAKGETVKIDLRLTPQTLPDVASANVVAEIRGRELPDEIVLLGAHLDSWDLATGAIDDGAGVAAIMESLRLMKEMKITPRRTIRAVLFMNEENGLRGGRGYFEAHKSEVGQHVAAIESDAGAAAPLGFITTLSPEGIATLQTWIEPIQALGATRLIYAPQTGADTSPLVGAGVIGFGVVQDPLHYFDWHHTPADTLDKVDPDDLKKNVAAIAFLAYTLAESGERLK